MILAILKKITEEIEESSELAEEIMIHHNEHSFGRHGDWPEEPCHVCDEDSGHNVDHYSTHITTGDYEDDCFQGRDSVQSRKLAQNYS